MYHFVNYSPVHQRHIRVSPTKYMTKGILTIHNQITPVSTADGLLLCLEMGVGFPVRPDRERPHQQRRRVTE